MDLLAELQSRIDRLKGLIANRIAYWGEKQYSEYLKNDSFWSRDEEDLKLFMQLRERLQPSSTEPLRCSLCGGLLYTTHQCKSVSA